MSIESARICLPEGADPELLRLFGLEPDDDTGEADASELLASMPEGER